MKFRSIRTPLLFVFCFTVLLPLVSLGLVAAFQSYRMVEAASQESLILAYADLDHILQGVLAMVDVAGPDGDLSRVRENVMNIKVGQSGYVYVLDAQGRYIVSKGGERDGESLWDAKDASDHYFIRSIVSKGLALGPGEIAEEQYPWQNPGDIAPRVKIARIGYASELGWIVGVGSYLDEFMAAPARIKKLSSQSILTFLITGVSAFAAAIIISLLFGSKLVRSLHRAVDVLKRVAAGDVDASLTAHSHDEFAQIAEALHILTSTIKRLLDGTAELTTAIITGHLLTRFSEEDLGGSYKILAEGINEALDALVGYLDTIPAPAMVIDDEFTILYINKAGADLGKAKAGDLISAKQKCFNFFKTEDCKSERCACAQAMRKQALSSSETRAALGDATYDISYRGIPIHDRSGKVVGAFEVVIDQTEAKNAARKMRKISDYQSTVIESLNHYLSKVASGDLSATFVVADADDDTRETKHSLDLFSSSLNESIESINDILVHVLDAVEQLNAASGQIAQASQSLSEGATNQASSLEETESAVALITSQTKRNSENAAQVNILAKDARSYAEHGNTQMKDLVHGMSDINTSAEEIAKIVKSIDDISFQINLLALNASVEAARAGKYGKGFSVVAEEVRRLAVRATASVAETSAMVNTAMTNVSRGNKLVLETAQQFDSIVKGTVEVSALSEEVSVASGNQSKGLDQITTGLDQINQVTQTNTTNAEETAAAAEEMASQMAQLQQMVHRFTLRKRDPLTLIRQ